MPTLQQAGAEVARLRTEQETFFAQFPKVGKLIDMPTEKAPEAQERNEAITAAAKAYEVLLEMQTMAEANGAARGKTRDADPSDDRQEAPANRKSLGELFTESDAFKSWRPSMRESDPFVVDLAAKFGKSAASRGVKALFDTATGYAPQAMRLPEAVVPGSEVASVASLMNEGRTSSNSISYMEETTTTSGAVEVTEGAAKGESTLALTEKTSAVRTIATHLPITNQALEDVPMIESYIDSRLRLFVKLRENSQLLNGNGVAPNLLGILATPGIQTQAKGADPTPDAFYRAGNKVRIGSFFEPTDAVVHPNDWTDVRLLRTVDGIYIWGSPADAGPERIWGWNVLVTAAEPEGTGLVGAFRAGFQIFRRSEISMQIGWINDQFTKNQKTILVEERLALVAFRPSAACLVTGI